MTRIANKRVVAAVLRMDRLGTPDRQQALAPLAVKTAAVTDQHVGGKVAVDHIVARTADEHVLAEVTLDDIVAAPFRAGRVDHPVVVDVVVVVRIVVGIVEHDHTAVTEDDVVAVVTGNHVVAITADDNVRTAHDAVVAVVAKDSVVAAIRLERYRHAAVQCGAVLARGNALHNVGSAAGNIGIVAE